MSPSLSNNVQIALGGKLKLTELMIVLNSGEKKSIARLLTYRYFNFNVLNLSVLNSPLKVKCIGKPCSNGFGVLVRGQGVHCLLGYYFVNMSAYYAPGQGKALGKKHDIQINLVPLDGSSFLC